MKTSLYGQLILSRLLQIYTRCNIQLVILLLKTNSIQNIYDFTKTHTIVEPMIKLYMNLIVYLINTSLIAPHLVMNNTSKLPIWLFDIKCKKNLNSVDETT